jgi:glutaredoxin/glutathione-dependent peroxiredoxin
MTITTGEKVPDVEVFVMGPEGGPQKVTTGELLGSGRVVLFAVPGAYTPGCSKVHLPGFVEGASELKGKGVDKIVCIAVNDAWVMEAWGKEQGVEDDIVMVGDGSGTFAEAMGLVMDGSGFGLGKRSKRYAAIIEDGTVTNLAVDDSGIELSSCSNVLSLL